MTFKVDRRIYSNECIANTIYWLSSSYSCKRSLESDYIESIEILPAADKDEAELEALFWDSLNDYNLRDIISKETKYIRTILYAKAFAECETITEAELNEV